MRVEDYYPGGKRWWVRLHEKGGKRHEMPAHHSSPAVAGPRPRCRRPAPAHDMLWGRLRDGDRLRYAVEHVQAHHRRMLTHREARPL
jgi:hypothetical protein